MTVIPSGSIRTSRLSRYSAAADVPLIVITAVSPATVTVYEQALSVKVIEAAVSATIEPCSSRAKASWAQLSAARRARNDDMASDATAARSMALVANSWLKATAAAPMTMTASKAAYPLRCRSPGDRKSAAVFDR